MYYNYVVAFVLVVCATLCCCQSFHLGAKENDITDFSRPLVSRILQKINLRSGLYWFVGLVLIALAAYLVS